MDRTYQIGVFEDTMARIKENEVLRIMQQQSIAEQQLILEDEALDLPAARFDEEAEVIVTKNRSFESALQ